LSLISSWFVDTLKFSASAYQLSLNFVQLCSFLFLLDRLHLHTHSSLQCSLISNILKVYVLALKFWPVELSNQWLIWKTDNLCSKYFTHSLKNSRTMLLYFPEGIPSNVNLIVSTSLELILLETSNNARLARLLVVEYNF
jgi:hypothetical protein